MRALGVNNVRRLKLLTGVETSTRPVSKSGNDGKRQTRSRRSTKAAPNTATLRRSTAMTASSELWNWRDQLIDLSLYSRCLGTTDARTRTGQLTASDRKKKLSGNFSSSYQQKLFGFFNFRAPTEFTMAKIKKKGMSAVFDFWNATANIFFY